MGSMYQEYQGVLGEAGVKISAGTSTGNGASFMVGRVSYTFGLAGETAAVDVDSSWMYGRSAF